MSSLFIQEKEGSETKNCLEFQTNLKKEGGVVGSRFIEARAHNKLKTKKIIIITVILLSLIGLLRFISSQLDFFSSEYIIDESDFVDGNDLIENIPASQLSEEEIAGLIQMREEEKLARDVYYVLGEKWNLKIYLTLLSQNNSYRLSKGALRSLWYRGSS